MLEGQRKDRNVFIIAEAGINHNGDVKLAKELIDAAFESGADAVKFQIFRVEDFYSRSHKGFSHTKSDIYDLMKSLELKDDEWSELKNYADEKGIIFFASVFDEGSFNLAENINLPIYKIASLDITNYPLLKIIADTKKPIILSTGFSTIEEISRAVKWIEERGNKNISILHCISLYPPNPDEINLSFIKTLKNVFPYKIGFSDHTLGFNITIAAVAMGAEIIEKHFTLDNRLEGPDQKLSLEPEVFKSMVRAIREIEQAVGNGYKNEIPEREKKILNIARRGIYAKREIEKDESLSNDNIVMKRPKEEGIGSEHYLSILGRKVKRKIKEGELLHFEDLQ